MTDVVIGSIGSGGHWDRCLGEERSGGGDARTVLAAASGFRSICKPDGWYVRLDRVKLVGPSS